MIMIREEMQRRGGLTKQGFIIMVSVIGSVLGLALIGAAIFLKKLFSRK